MRILHVNKFLYRRGGAEAYMEDLADLQVAAGHTVSFFGMAHPLNTHLDYASHYPRDIEFEPPPAQLSERVRGQDAERLGEPLRAPDERDAQRDVVGDAGRAERREVAVDQA